jgi:hypothetical protein
MWSATIRRHHLVRLTALDPGCNISALFYNADDPLDRLNLPDTLKALHTAKLTQGHVLMSDMGRSLLSITRDTLGWHDPLGGHITSAQVAEKYGERRYQEFRNDFHRNARDNFLIELAKYGLGIRDIVANVNFFSRVAVDDSGMMTFDAAHCTAGASLTLRADLNVRCILANCPHPMALPGAYPRARVQLELLDGPPPGPDDACRMFRPECARALELSQRYFL